MYTDPTLIILWIIALADLPLDRTGLDVVRRWLEDEPFDN